MQQAVCVPTRKKKEKKKNPAAPKTHLKIHSSMATTINSGRCARFVEIGLVQTVSIIKNHECSTQTDYVL